MTEDGYLFYYEDDRKHRLGSVIAKQKEETGVRNQKDKKDVVDPTFSRLYWTNMYL